MKKIALIASVAIVLVACSDRKKSVTATQPINLNGQLNSSGANAGKLNPQVPSPGTVTLNPAHGQPGHKCEVGVGEPLPSTAAMPVASSVPTVTTTEKPIINTIDPIAVSQPQTATGKAPAGNLNPAHGQPGHRCDISVGAPLNSAPSKKSDAPQNVTIEPVNTPTVTAPGMNPQHGQPGHRCDIAVGAPLNSPAGKTDSLKN